MDSYATTDLKKKKITMNLVKIKTAQDEDDTQSLVKPVVQQNAYILRFLGLYFCELIENLHDQESFLTFCVFQPTLLVIHAHNWSKLVIPSHNWS